MISSSVPRVAVITRTKDRPLLLRRAIESVLGQELENFIHVIVNDGGEPCDVDFLLDEYRTRYRDRLLVIHNPKSGGMQEASNMGIQASKSDYIAIHDDDDSWHESFLYECVSQLDLKGPLSSYQGIATQSIRINEDITPDDRVVEVSRENYYPFQTIGLYRLASDNLFPPIAFLYRRQVHEALGFFNEKFTVLGDWDFNLRFLTRFDIVVHDRPLANYHWRIGKGSGSYGNTVTSGIDKHQEQLVLMQNHYLREDITLGRIGLGYLLCNSKMQHGLCHLAWQQQHTLSEIDSKIPKPWLLRELRDCIRWCWSFTDIFWPPPSDQRNTPRTANPITVEQIRAELQNAKVLSIDVFDTALLRIVNKPTDIFKLMESEAQKILDKKRLPFAKLRIQAESDARRYAREISQSDEVTIKQIYEAFGTKGGWSEAAMEALISLELKTEDECLYANPKIVDLVAYAEKGGILVIYISDMYFPSEIIRKMLEKKGFRVETLFVSCEHGTSKHVGGLYEVLIKSLHLEPKRVLHIGDNHRSDYVNASDHGLKAMHVDHLMPRNLADESSCNVVFPDGDIAASLCLGLTRRFAAERDKGAKSDNDAADSKYWKALGYEVAGPIYFLFLHWIISRSTKDNISRLFFFSRDGYALIKTFAILKKYWHIPFEAEYLFASRRLYNFAKIDRLDSSTLDFLLCPNPGLSVRDFIARCGFEAEPYEQQLAALGLPELGQVITTAQGQFDNPSHRVALDRFIKTIECDFLAKCSEEREVLYKYLHYKGYSTKGTAVVDVGWRASLCRSLQDLMHRRGEKGNLKAYLFGSWKYAKSALVAGCELDSFFFHLDDPPARKELISECVEIVELLFSAPHPSIIGLESTAAGIEPVYGTHEHNEQELAQLEIMRASALAFVEDAAASVTDGLSMPPSHAYVEAVLDRVLRHPTKEEAGILGKFQHRDGFGDKGPMRYLAKPPPPSEGSGSDLKYAYDHSYWKAGFRAQLSSLQKRRMNSL